MSSHPRIVPSLGATGEWVKSLFITPAPAPLLRDVSQTFKSNGKCNKLTQKTHFLRHRIYSSSTSHPAFHIPFCGLLLPWISRALGFSRGSGVWVSINHSHNFIRTATDTAPHSPSPTPPSWGRRDSSSSFHFDCYLEIPSPLNRK